MNLIIENQRSKLDGLCRRFHVAKLELFGSATDPQRFDTQKSDLDFLVEFQYLPPGEYAESYFGLLEGLGQLFQRNIDLLMPNAIQNQYLRDQINRERILIYAA
ncbi:MAG: nucleotidyltransferase domain-containing protein [Sedimentisphaerales bacterium]|nr:nucleotidyltransferase domain-containing protein [Sedimentisphaerales bacterium]